MDREGEGEGEKTITTTTRVVAAVDWLELPQHLTSLIFSRLSSITDYARLGSVCTKWLSILLTDDEDHYTKSLPPQLPLLMIPTPPISHKKKKNKKKKSNSSKISCSFYRVTDGKIFNGLQLTMPRDRYVRGSSHGWLVTIDADDLFFSIQLMNPFFYPNTSTKLINLPPLTAHPSCENPDHLYYVHLRKAVLSANPISNSKDFIVMAIITEFQTLAFCKPGDKSWTPITDNMKGVFKDIIYHEDKFYALHFQVFKLQRREEEAVEWVEVKDLCNRVFFVGDNASISISASDFLGCKPNCIYYTDDNILNYFHDEECGPHVIGVFNVENENFEKHYPTDVNIQIWPAPIWIEPTLPRSFAHLKRNINCQETD